MAAVEQAPSTPGGAVVGKVAPWLADALRAVLAVDAGVKGRPLRSPTAGVMGSPMALGSPRGSPRGAEVVVDLRSTVSELVPEEGGTLDGTDAGVMDRLVMERLLCGVTETAGNKLDWLMRSYDAAVQLGKDVPVRIRERLRKDGKGTDDLVVVLMNMREMLIRYSTLVLMGSFDEDVDGEERVCEAFVRLASARMLPQGFLPHLVRYLNLEDESGEQLSDLFNPVLDAIMHRFRPSTLAEEDISLRGVAVAEAGSSAGVSFSRLESYQSGLDGLLALLSQPELRRIVTNRKDWMQSKEDIDGSTLERDSVLGYLFGHGPSKGDFDVGGRDIAARLAEEGRLDGPEASQTEQHLKSLQDGLDQYRAHTFNVVKQLFKSGGAVRESMLQWFGACVDGNADRAKIAFLRHLNDEATSRISSCVAVSNATSSMLQMCEAFLDPHSPLSYKIDISYLSSGRRFAMRGNALAADVTDTDEKTEGAEGSGDASGGDREDGEAAGGDAGWVDPRNLARARTYEQARREQVQVAMSAAAPAPTDAPHAPAATYGTVSEFFGLALELAHLGIMQSMAKLKVEKTENGRLHDRLKELKAQMAEERNPYTRSRMESTLHMAQRAVLASTRRQLVIRSLTGKTFLEQLIRLYHMLSVALLRVVCSGTSLGKPAETVPRIPIPRYPLPAPSALLMALPEYIVGDLASFLSFFGPQLPISALWDVAPAQLSTFITVMVTFASSPLYCGNPYVRGQLINALLVFMPHHRMPEGLVRRQAGFYELLRNHEAAITHLPGALLEFFVTIEKTGSHTAFYDKFQYREAIVDIIAYVWDGPAAALWKRRFQELSMSEDFMKFLNHLCNDLLYHMDEATSHLKEVKELEFESGGAGGALDPARRQELSQKRNSAGYELRQASKMLRTFKVLSDNSLEPFLSPQLRARTAELLNGFLNQLVGPDSSKLKISNREEIGFNPREVLFEVTSVVGNLSKAEPEHVAALAKAILTDPRCTDVHANFDRAVSVLQKDPSFVAEHPDLEVRLSNMRAFARAVRDAEADNDESDEDEVDDAPDEYVCVLSGDLMDDPVTLPNSGQIVERSFIARHLLNDGTDPFTRTPLALDQVEPNAELQAEIKKWRTERRAKRRLAKTVATTVVGKTEEETAAAETAASAVARGQRMAASAEPRTPEPTALSTQAAVLTERGGAVPPAPRHVFGDGGGAESGAMAPDGDDEDSDLQAALLLSQQNATVANLVLESMDDDEGDDDLAAALAMSMRDASGSS